MGGGAHALILWKIFEAEMLKEQVSRVGTRWDSAVWLVLESSGWLVGWLVVWLVGCVWLVGWLVVWDQAGLILEIISSSFWATCLDWVGFYFFPDMACLKMCFWMASEKLLDEFWGSISIFSCSSLVMWESIFCEKKQPQNSWTTWFTSPCIKFINHFFTLALDHFSNIMSSLDRQRC